jgi:hypothetical protein
MKKSLSGCVRKLIMLICSCLCKLFSNYLPNSKEIVKVTFLNAINLNEKNNEITQSQNE